MVRKVAVKYHLMQRFINEIDGKEQYRNTYNNGLNRHVLIYLSYFNHTNNNLKKP